MRKHHTAKAPKQVSECCCIQHLPSIAGISFPTIRALKTWHRNKKHQCMSVLGDTTSVCLAVQQGKCFETLECCSVSRQLRAVKGCASRIECTRKRVSNDSPCHWVQHAKASYSENTKTSVNMLLNTTCTKHCRKLSSDNSSVNSTVSKKF